MLLFQLVLRKQTAFFKPCDCALNVARWIDSESPKYSWLLATHCDLCGKWIGNRPKAVEKDEKAVKEVQTTFRRSEAD